MDIDILKGASAAIEAIVKSLHTFTASIRDAIKVGYETLEFIKAKKAQDRLHNMIMLSKKLLSAQMAVMYGKPNKGVAGFLPALDDFIKSGGKEESAWIEARGYASRISEEIDHLIEEVGKEKGSVILEEAYSGLLHNLEGRKKALRGLNQLQASDVDIEELRYFYLIYGELYLSLQAAVNALVEYARKLEKTT